MYLIYSVYGPPKMLSHKNFDPKHFWPLKKFGPLKFFDSQQFLTPNLFAPKNFWTLKIVKPRKIKYQKKCTPEKFWPLNFCYTLTFLTPKVFRPLTKILTLNTIVTPKKFEHQNCLKNVQPNVWPLHFLTPTIFNPPFNNINHFQWKQTDWTISTRYMPLQADRWEHI